jgi:hypothetical protein
VIIQHGQRTDGRVPAFRTFKIHLPQLVGSAPFKSAGGLGVPVLIAHQIVTQQHTMDRIARQLHLFPRQAGLAVCAHPSRGSAGAPRRRAAPTPQRYSWHKAENDLPCRVCRYYEPDFLLFDILCLPRRKTKDAKRVGHPIFLCDLEWASNGWADVQRSFVGNPLALPRIRLPQDDGVP